MSSIDAAKGDLARQLRVNREALRWKLEGLTEHDQRRPLTPTGKPARAGQARRDRAAGLSR